MPRITKRPYKDEADLDKEYPDPPFTHKDFEEVRKELAEVEASRDPGSTILPRTLWLVKKGGGRLQNGELMVRVEQYKKLSERWNKFTEWQAKIEFAESERLKQLDEISKQNNQ